MRARGSPALFALLFCVGWGLAARRSPVGDARSIVATARALASSATLDVAQFPDGNELPSTIAHEGRRRATSNLGAALTLLPAELLARAFEKRDPEHLWELLAARLLDAAVPAAAVALACALLFGALVRRGLSQRAALFFALALFFATPMVWFARMPDATALATLLLYWATLEARRFVAAPEGGEWGVGLTLGALIVVEPTLTLGAFVILAWCGLHRHERFDRRTAARTLAPVAAGIAVVLAHRLVTGARGDLPGPLVQGLVGFLLSPGKSIFLYAPIAILAVPSLLRAWKPRRAETELTLALSAAVLIATARLLDWHGDPTWGPRRIVPLLPSLVETVALAWQSFAPDRRRMHSLGLAAAMAVGVYVQALGVILPVTTYRDVLTRLRMDTAAPSWFALSPDEAHFMPQFSPILGHQFLIAHMIRNDARFDRDAPWRLLIAKSPEMASVASHLGADFLARDLPLPATLGWLFVLVAGAGASLWRLLRRRG
jgi:hypothetical protein